MFSVKNQVTYYTLFYVHNSGWFNALLLSARILLDDLRKSKGLHSVSAYGHGAVCIGQLETHKKVVSDFSDNNYGLYSLFINGHRSLFASDWG